MPTTHSKHTPSLSPFKVAVIGAGPAGLMAAQVLAENGLAPVVFDAMPSAARKFLQAGRGGLNLTHGEDFERFKTRYFEANHQMAHALKLFSPTDARAWAEDLGFETFIGSSGKVYPLDKKAAPLLRAWLHQLKQLHTQFKMRHRWLGWQASTEISTETDKSISNLTWLFDTPQGVQSYQFDAVILALGGASWPHLGSTGDWVEVLKKQGLNIAPLTPANMGFEVSWSTIFCDKFAGTPLKNVELSLVTQAGVKIQQLGELMVTAQGVEGSLIYTHSKAIGEQITAQGSTKITLDLFPHRTEAQLMQQLSRARGKQSLSAFWKRQGLSGVKASLLREVLNAQQIKQPGLVVSALKQYPLQLNGIRPLKEAISTAGGICFSELNQGLMMTSLPGVYAVGEMLDWQAPTGGYLLTGVMAQGKQAGLAVLRQHAKTSNRTAL